MHEQNKSMQESHLYYDTTQHLATNAPAPPTPPWPRYMRHEAAKWRSLDHLKLLLLRCIALFIVELSNLYFKVDI